MTAFSTFTYAKKYFVSPEIEFVTEPDPEFGEPYKPPENLTNLLADNIVVYDKVGIGTTAADTGTANQVIQAYGGAYVSGSVGIGTTNPSDPLDVNGNIRLRSGLKDFYGNVGVAGSVLISTANGVEWGTVAITSTTNLTLQTLNVTGVSTLANLQVVGDVFVSGVITCTDLNSTMDIKINNTTVIDDSRQFIPVTISAGSTTGTSGQVLQSTGVGVTWATIAAASGQLLRAPQILTSGTTYTAAANCTSIYVEAVGGGGGGGEGAPSDGGGGGGAGGYCAKYFTVVAGTSYTYAIGAGGIANSGNGGNTTFTVGGTTITAGGGGGGIVGDSEDTDPNGGLGGSSTNGDLNVTGSGGGAGSFTRTSGAGGSSFFGGGGRGVYNSAANAGEHGGGGGGGSNSRNGAAGGAGLIRISEYS